MAVFILSSYVVTSRGWWRHSRSLSFEHFWQENTSREKSYHPPVNCSSLDNMDSNQNLSRKMCKIHICMNIGGDVNVMVVVVLQLNLGRNLNILSCSCVTNNQHPDLTFPTLPLRRCRWREKPKFSFSKNRNRVKYRRFDKDLTGIFAVSLVRRLKEIKI